MIYIATAFFLTAGFAADLLMLKRLGLHEGAVLVVAVHPDGRRGLSGGLDQKITLWNLEDGRRISRACQHPEEITALCFVGDPIAKGGTKAPSNALNTGVAISACGDRQIREWNLENGAEVRRVGGHDHRIFDLLVSPNQEDVFAVSGDGQLRKWRRRGDGPHEIPVKDRQAVQSLVLAPAARRLYFAGVDRRIESIDLARKEAAPTWVGHRDTVHCLAMSGDETQLFSAGSDKTVHVWDVRTGKILAVLEGHPDPIFAITIWEKRVVAAGRNGNIVIWDQATRSEIGRQRLPAGVLAMAPARDSLLLGLADGSVWTARPNIASKTPAP